MITETQEEILRRKAFNDIMSNKYFVHGKCFNCGEEYAYCTNKIYKNSSRDLYCSDECWKEFKKQKRKRDREKNHYQVFKDENFYYIVVNGDFNHKRNFEGKTFMKKSEQDKQREEDISKRISNWKHHILSEKAKIPKEAIKIIDKVSAYLYDEEHRFCDWEKLRENNQKGVKLK